MTEINFKTYIKGVKNDVKIAVDDVFAVLEKIGSDVEKLKFENQKPDKYAAQAILEYIAMDEGKSKKNMEALCGKDLQQYLKWIENYCTEHNCTQEEALQRIIDED